MLAGGTDGEQLAEVLLDREEELRAKEDQLKDITRQLQVVSSDSRLFEADRIEYEASFEENWFSNLSQTI